VKQVGEGEHDRAAPTGAVVGAIPCGCPLRQSAFSLICYKHNENLFTTERHGKH